MVSSHWTFSLPRPYKTLICRVYHLKIAVRPKMACTAFSIGEPCTGYHAYAREHLCKAYFVHLMFINTVADPGHLVRGRFMYFTFSLATSGNSYESCIKKATIINVDS